jgi:hypothetical protein
MEAVNCTFCELHTNCTFGRERATRIELAFSAWETARSQFRDLGMTTKSLVNW